MNVTLEVPWRGPRVEYAPGVAGKLGEKVVPYNVASPFAATTTSDTFS